MPDLYGYDFSDEQIRRLVETNHVPVENVLTSSEGTTLRPVVCGFCQANWPCEPITALRTWKDTHGYDVTGASDVAINEDWRGGTPG